MDCVSGAAAQTEIDSICVKQRLWLRQACHFRLLTIITAAVCDKTCHGGITDTVSKCGGWGIPALSHSHAGEVGRGGWGGGLTQSRGRV